MSIHNWSVSWGKEPLDQSDMWCFVHSITHAVMVGSYQRVGPLELEDRNICCCDGGRRHWWSEKDQKLIRDQQPGRYGAAQPVAWRCSLILRTLKSIVLNSISPSTRAWSSICSSGQERRLKTKSGNNLAAFVTRALHHGSSALAPTVSSNIDTALPS